MNKAKISVARQLLPMIVLGASVALSAPANATPLSMAAISSVAGLADFTELVEKSGPAVVNIRTTGKASAGEEDEGDDVDGDDQSDQDKRMQDFLRRFFGAPQGHAPIPKGKQAPAPSDPEDDVPRGVGSGFIISQDGYVMTNAHVIDGATDVIVKMTDSREFKAKVIGVDARSDVAVLKIDGTNLPTVTIGSSAKARVGEWVIAIGSPFDLDNSVTAGIISAKGRETGDFLPFIQTDVAVNPGNSGGPLINMRGEVVGINAQIYSKSGGYMGISFAIPIDDAIRVADQLKTSGHVTRGLLGVYLGDVSKEVAESLGLPNAKGAVVGRLEKGSPADKAGIRDGDIILKFNDVTVERSAELRRLVAATAPDTKIKLAIWRKGSAKDVSVILAALPPDTVAQAAGQDAPPELAVQIKNAYGMSVDDLSEVQKKALGLAAGVVLNDVDGAAAHAGLRAGDILLTLNNQDIQDGKQFAALVAKADPKKPLLLLARRGETAQFVVVHPVAH